MAENRRQRAHRNSDEETDDRLPTVYLKPGEADRVIAGHPWVYEGSILRLVREPEDGDVVQVKDHRRRLLGIGFYNSRSKIRVRVLSSVREEIDRAFFERRLRAAWEHRKRFLPHATSCRVVNAEGDRLSGLIVDKYEDLLVVQMSSAGMDRRKGIITQVLQDLLSPRAILERNDMGARRFEGLPDASGLLAGEVPEDELRAWPARINGIEFEVDLEAGHKTGLYLDQQINQAKVAELARGARVLDAFCFVGGFSLHAAREGAASVVGVDQSEAAIRIAERLARRNGVSERCEFVAANAFDWLRARTTSAAAEKDLFDLVILDPPSFTRNRAAVPDALRGYKEIHLRALRLLRPGGILATFCCSHHVDGRTFERTVGEACLDARRPVRRLASFSQAADHPILPAIPETEYLKGFAYEVLAP